MLTHTTKAERFCLHQKGDAGMLKSRCKTALYERNERRLVISRFLSGTTEADA